MSDSNITPKQELFLEYLFNDTECSGNPKLAAEKAGYGKQDQYRLMKELREEILHRTQLELALKAPVAASKLISMMDEDGSTPKAEIRLKAVESVLDRIGVSKKQEVEFNSANDLAPIFLIPAKTSLELDKEDIPWHE